jgi:FtsH ternary system domain X5
MSRAYRIRVSESLNRTLQAEDEVCSHLELLEVLPPEQMADLLREELKQRGFAEKDGRLVRQDEGVTVEIDPNCGEVVLTSAAKRDVSIEAEREGLAYDDIGPAEKTVKKSLQKQLQSDLERQAQREQGKLQSEATKRLEGHLADMQKELNQAVNRVTAEALKRKAAQLGAIKEMSEDPQTGSLTIKVEV